jgi:hypothetical protein
MQLSEKRDKKISLKSVLYHGKSLKACKINNKLQFSW